MLKRFLGSVFLNDAYRGGLVLMLKFILVELFLNRCLKPVLDPRTRSELGNFGEKLLGKGVKIR